MNHLTAEELERYADGEMSDAEHLRDCARCATAVLQIVQMKHAVHDVMREDVPSRALRERLATGRSQSRWWLAAAAVIAVTFLTILAVRSRTSSAVPELVDMHVTLLASANPVDVVSTDRHTVKPWFEGRLPFTVPVPDLAATPFRLIGGRIVYWRANPAAYLLIGKGAHRISLFIFRDDLAPHDLSGAPAAVTTNVWRTGGLTFVAIAQVPPGDLQELRLAFR